MITITQARAAKETVKQLLVGQRGIAGIGISWDDDGRPAVLVNVEHNRANTVRALLPSVVNEVAVQVEEISPITFH